MSFITNPFGPSDFITTDMLPEIGNKYQFYLEGSAMDGASSYTGSIWMSWVDDKYFPLAFLEQVTGWTGSVSVQVVTKYIAFSDLAKVLSRNEADKEEVKKKEAELKGKFEEIPQSNRVQEFTSWVADKFQEKKRNALRDILVQQMKLNGIPMEKLIVINYLEKVATQFGSIENLHEVKSGDDYRKFFDDLDKHCRKMLVTEGLQGMLWEVWRELNPDTYPPPFFKRLLSIFQCNPGQIIPCNPGQIIPFPKDEDVSVLGLEESRRRVDFHENSLGFLLRAVVLSRQEDLRDRKFLEGEYQWLRSCLRDVAKMVDPLAKEFKKAIESGPEDGRLGSTKGRHKIPEAELMDICRLAAVEALSGGQKKEFRLAKENWGIARTCSTFNGEAFVISLKSKEVEPLGAGYSKKVTLAILIDLQKKTARMITEKACRRLLELAQEEYELSQREEMQHPAIEKIFPMALKYDAKKKQSQNKGDRSGPFEDKRIVFFAEEAKALDRSKLPRPLIPLLIPFLEAIDHLHGQGLIIRDIKWPNILLSQEGRLILTDLGMVGPPDRLKKGATGNLTLFVGGNHSTLAPEIVARPGQPGSGQSVQTDIWAIGVLLWQATLEKGTNFYRNHDTCENLDVKVAEDLKLKWRNHPNGDGLIAKYLSGFPPRDCREAKRLRAVASKCLKVQTERIGLDELMQELKEPLSKDGEQIF